ncbi:SDR family NAD(P)-dependent oxidoreductase [Pseudothioclava nitratireducens]|jgi:7-alpha-hydroxysteroid dehydrogenase|uniref:SDR family NAD(P)-dependent oxidoreductase n=1 Tax=Pseudothioclava nitratireducens TaxID=1928646 RepID=UPI0023DBAE17|nr:SDR family oxidoreductase [Defluviimonas nitratireducens]MDF1619060.1 SDR family oxidoreductase [Defluviimonas nitratireducens]
MSLSISGKTAIVTGAAHGIGLAIARHFIDRGAQVMFADIDEARLADELGTEAKSDGSARYFAGDLCQKLTVNNLLSATIDAFERIDILVNAARCIQVSDPLDPAQTVLDDMLQLNMKGMLRMSQMTAKRMISHAEQDGRRGEEIGAIVNISTPANASTQPELLAYSIACAAQEQATRGLAVALAPHGIRVNGVAFASVMSASLQNQLKEHGDWRDAMTDGTPLGRIAAPGELTHTVQYLASPGAGFVTGQIVTVDGGRGLGDAVRVPAF